VEAEAVKEEVDGHAPTERRSKITSNSSTSPMNLPAARCRDLSS